MDNPNISYRPLPDATPEAEAEVLAAVYSFLIERQENRRAADHDGGKESRGDNDRRSGTPSGSGGPQTAVHQQGAPVRNLSNFIEEAKTYYG